MKKIILFIYFYALISACGWDKPKGGNPGDGLQPPTPSSSIYTSYSDMGVVKLAELKTDLFKISNPFSEEADVLIKVFDGNGNIIKDNTQASSIFSISATDCSLKDGYTKIPANGECNFIYNFTPQEYQYYTNVVSVDIIGKSFYENGDSSAKRRIDAYFEGAGSPDGKELPPKDYAMNFNGVNRYLVDGQKNNIPAFKSDILEIEYKNETGNNATLRFTNADGSDYNSVNSEFRWNEINSQSYCSITQQGGGKGFSLASGASCKLQFTYVPSSKKERGIIYLKPEGQGAHPPIGRIIFFGAAYPLKYSNTTNFNFGKVGINTTMADTVLDLESKIKRGEDLTLNFDNPFGAYIFITPEQEGDNDYTLNFDQTQDFSISDDLSDCEINGSNVKVRQGGCGITVTFKPKEIRTYNGIALSFTSHLTSKTITYIFEGEGVLMKRATIPDAILTDDKFNVNVKVGQTYYIGINLTDNATYSFAGDNNAFGIADIYPGCKAENGELKIKAGAESCMVYIAFTPPTVGMFNWTLRILDRSYSFIESKGL